MYLAFPVIVLVLFTMFIPQLWTELKGKHCPDHYDYDRKNQIQSRSFSLLKMYSTKRPFIQNLVFLLVLHFFAIEQSSIFTKSIEKVFLFCSDSSFISLIRNKSRCLSTFYGPLIYMKLQKKEPRMGSTTHIRVKHFLESKSKFSRLQFLQNIF